MADEFITKARKIHGSKYDYSKVCYESSKKNIVIICSVHGEFRQTPSNHLMGRGCKKCSNDRKLLTTNGFIQKSNLVHKNKYQYYAPYVNSHTKMDIICPIHGKFEQTPNDHLSGYGCSMCSKNKKDTSQTFIEKAIRIHGNEYDYSRINYINNLTKVRIICRKHGEFLQTPSGHTDSRNGCPVCCNSKGEREIINFLEKNKIGYVFQKTFDNCRNPKTNCKLKFDFFIPNKNILIEYDGKQHFHVGANIRGKHIVTESELKDTQYKDNIKDCYSKSNNIKLLRISYTKINIIPQLLEEIL